MSRLYKIIILAIMFTMSSTIYTAAESDPVDPTNDSVEQSEILPEGEDSEQVREVVNELITIVSKGEYNRNEANKMVERINKIDQNLRQGLIDQGVVMFLVDFPITDLDEFSHLKVVVPRGWEDTGSTWDDVPGAGGKPSVARIGYSDNLMGHGSINLELHEIAHAIDSYVLNDIGSSEEFLEIHAEEQPNFLPSPYFQYSIEYFAESFAYYYLNETTRTELKQYAPKTYELIQSFGEPTPVNKEELEETIKEASAFVENQNNKQLAKALQDAIQVRDNTDATQEEVDEAVNKLRKAIEDAEKEQSTPVNKEELNNTIEHAEGIDEELITDKLKTALELAIQVSDNTEATQEEVNQALNDLRKAIEDADQDQNTPVNKEELSRAIEQTEALDEELISDELKTALELAIQVRDNTEATQEEVNQALNDLRQAIEDAEKEQVTPVNKQKLSRAIEQAETLDEELITDELKTALNLAIQVRDNTEATQDEVDQAVNKLRKALQEAEKNGEIQFIAKENSTNKEEGTSTNKNSESNILPYTATNIFIYIVSGFLFLLFGSITWFSYEKYKKLT